MSSFRKYTCDEIKKSVKPEWISPKIDPKLYKRIKPLSEVELWSGTKGEIFAAHIPEGVNIPKYHYSVAYHLMHALLSKTRSPSKVLIKPNNSAFVGAFWHDPRLREIMRLNGMDRNADLQPIATQPALMAGIVDALLEVGVDEIHIAENMLWPTPLRAFWETGYVHVFSNEKYRGKVFFVDPYEGEVDLVELPIKYIKEYDLGFFTKTRPPKALFDEKYDLVVVASIAKMHNSAYYSLLMKNFSITWNPPSVRWHVHGVPIKLFDREYVSRLLNEDIPQSRRYEVFLIKERAIISNGLVSSAPLMVCKEEDELLVVSDVHLLCCNMAPFILGMGYVVIRYIGMYATLAEELRRRGTDIVGILSGIVGMDGEGPLIYGRRRLGGFALASTNFVATESLALDIMVGYGNKGFPEILTMKNKSFCEKYSVSRIDDVMVESKDVWSLRLAERLLNEPRDPHSLSLTLFDFEGMEEVRNPWDLRNGPPFKLPKGVFVSPITWLRLIYLEEELFKHSLDFIDKGIVVPLVPI
ncbi:MAG: hypothetical protein DRJ66_03130 [Thermoprotei archaeon]|nr:MAG: hypothetical protein DRJ66_03130 [Thermoprotei archaeon]